jgi:O-antigen/teichoic acid export membrane protein
VKKIASLLNNNKDFLGKASASLADQILLSLLNFAVGIIFIKYANKHEYAAYSQVYAIVYLTSSVQGALINSPALTLLPKETKQSRSKIAGSFFVLQAGLSIIFACLFGILLYFIPNAISFENSTPLLALAFALTIWSVWIRDFLRNQLFISLKPVACFKLDLIYFIVCTIFLYGLIKYNAVTADFALLAMFFATLLSTLPWLFKADIDFHFNPLEIIKTFNSSWELAKWSLPGGIISWAFGNGYVLIAAYTVGSLGTAEIAAARLFVAPLGMVYLAWSNLFRPIASHWIVQGRIGMVKSTCYAALVAIAFGVSLYSAILMFSYPYLETHILSQKYFGLSTDIEIWACFFFVSGVANIGTGALLALGHFKESFYASLAGCVVSLPLMFILGTILGKVGILLGLTFGELVTAGSLIIKMRNGLNQLANISKTI